MSGIQHLYDIYNKKGDDFVDNLFNTFVTVNEKMDGTAFTFEKERGTGRLKFFKRDQNNPINKIDRTLMSYYENPIQYIESLPPHILKMIPEGYRFGLEYFANEAPQEIVYDRIPKNHLILSYVHEYGDNGKIKNTIQDKNELDSWADLLGIDRAPIIFQGYLNEDQKLDIRDFLSTPFDKLVEKFSTTSFVRYIITILNPDLESTALNDSLDKGVEGIVFRFGDKSNKDSEIVLAKMVDPVFTDLAKKKSADKKDKKPSDFLGIALVDVMNFILEKGVASFGCEGDDEDERYVSFMSNVFVDFLDEYADKYKGMDFQEPEFLKKEGFRVNQSMLTNREAIKLINEDPAFESLFKTILNSFRKIRKRADSIITPDIKEHINSLVSEIFEYIKEERRASIKESKFLTFSEYLKESKSQVDYIIDEEKSESLLESEGQYYSFNDFIGTLETIGKKNPIEPIKEENEKEEEDKEKKHVNVLIGRFQPFHNGHLQMAKFLKEKNGYPSVIAAVYSGNKKNEKSPFSEETLKKYLGAVKDGHPEEIADFMIMNRGLLAVALGKIIEMGYIPHIIGAGADRMDDYKRQMNYVRQIELGDKLPDDFQLQETPRVTSATEVRNKIKEDDFSGFRNLVPKEVASMYTTLKSEIGEVKDK